jgi:flagellar hook-basal body complex protein FliE
MRTTGPNGAAGALPLLAPHAPAAGPAPVTPGAETPGVDFATELGRAVSQAGAAERTSAEMSQKFAAGDPSVGLHEVMIASEKAAIGVRYAVTLQKKLVDAYRELMQTNI